MILPSLLKSCSISCISDPIYDEADLQDSHHYLQPWSKYLIKEYFFQVTQRKQRFDAFVFFYKYFLCKGTFLVSVIAVILLITVTNSSITARMPHLLGCRLMTGWEGRTHQRFLPPGRSLILKNIKHVKSHSQNWK